jgi:hypothetical protein
MAIHGNLRQLLHIRLRARGSCKTVISRGSGAACACRARRAFAHRDAGRIGFASDITERDCISASAATAASAASAGSTGSAGAADASVRR